MSADGCIDKENVLYNTIKYYSSHKKEGNLANCDNMDEPGGHFATWN